jgi:hypothetical protein
MQMRVRRPWSARALVLLALLAASVGANAQPQSPPSATCVGLDAATPTQHLEHALRDPNYGLCLASLAGEQKAACDALPALGPNDPAAGARKRQCQQVANLFQDLSFNFRWDAEYRGLVDDCKRSGASLSCDRAAAIEKRMRCMLAAIVGGDTGECMGPVPQPPPFPAKK